MNIFDKEAMQNFTKLATGYDPVKTPIGRGHDWSLKKLEEELKTATGPT